ncbi:MAG: hypothetical protein GY929_09000 [Actinomycetia bacterium]|nr:hypothetical protein [Actinomycetes bacterium]
MAASDRMNASTLQLWLAADAVAAPVVGDAVASVRRINPNASRPSADQTAAGDDWQYHTAGIPGGTVTFEGELQGDQFQAFIEFDDGAPRNFSVVPVAAAAAVQIDGTGFLESWSSDGNIQNGWRFTAVIRLTAALVPAYV